MYSIILADPPWSYQYPGRGSAKSHYQTMSGDGLKEIKVERICNNDCLLFMWATFPMLSDALDLIKDWGFEYKTCAFTWIKIVRHGSILKPSIGNGFYTRGNAEVCLLGMRGNGLPRKDKGVSQIIMAPTEGHSVKPREVFRRIEKLYGDVPRIELFARKVEPGWDAWGDELKESSFPANVLL